MTSATSPLSELMTPLVGAEHVREARPDDAVDGRQPALIVAPGSDEEAAHVLRTANEHGLAIIPRGGGTKLGWGNHPRSADIVLSTERMNRLIEHPYGDMTATAEAGITLATLQTALAQHGQMLALDPAWPDHATLGGIIATDTSGPLRVRYGTMRDLLIGIGVVLPDGTIAYGGGKVVKNVAGYDLMKLFTGALGTLGLITTVTVRLHPLPAHTTSLRIALPTATAAQELVLHINHSTLTPIAVQVVASGQELSAFVRFGGVEASLAAQTHDLTAAVERMGLRTETLNDAIAASSWQQHQAIYRDPASALVARVSVVPTATALLLETTTSIANRLRVASETVVHATGTGLVRFESTNEQALLAAAGALRARLTEIGGSLVVQQCPLAAKERLDVWGSSAGAGALMQRIKEQFDPRGTLNPGRYIGRI